MGVIVHSLSIYEFKFQFESKGDKPFVVSLFN